MNFIFEKQSIPDVVLITPKRFGDSRGFFSETFRQNLFSEHGMSVSFVQDNLSRSNRGVLRGLHYQLNPHAQGKLVQVITGAVFDVAVDIRQSSKTFGQHVGVTLSAENGQLLWVPPGFAHGFLVLEDNTHFVYKTTDYYHPELERAILWSDAALGVRWPGDLDIQLSEKDKKAPCLRDAENNYV